MEFTEGKEPIPLILIEEISLEGLEGITIDGIWKRLSQALDINLPILINFQNQVWNFIKKSQSLLQFYELPEAREKLKIFNRKDYTDSIGECILPDECPFTRYEYCPIEDGEIRGSCQFYKTRKNISFEEIKKMSLDEVLGRWGDKFVIVAVQHIRENFLIPETSQVPRDFNVHHYCVLEVIGRSRYNGESTCGKHSIMYLCKDSALLFYVKNILTEHKLIEKQQYYEKSTSRTNTGQLLSLPKFFMEYKTKAMHVIETVFKLIQSKENGFVSMHELKIFYSTDTLNSLKKIRAFSVFKKCFEMTKLPHREIFPNSEISEYMQKNKMKEKFIIGYRLKDPNMKLEDIWGDDEPKEETISEFSNSKDYYIDMPIINQVFKFINDSGAEGANQSTIRKYIGVSRYVIRAVLKKLEAAGVVKTYMKDFGRQRTGMYVTVHHGKLRFEKPFQDEKKTLLLTQSDAEQNKDHIAEFEKNSDNSTLHSEEPNNSIHNEEDTLSVEATVRNLPEPTYKMDPQWGKKLTERQMKRKNLIICIVNEKKVIELANLYKILKDTEAKKGYKEELCRKSLQRLIHHLIIQNIFNGYEIMLKKESYARVYKYITLLDISSKDELFQNEIMKCKTTFHLSILDKQHRQRNAVKQLLAMEKNEDKNINRPIVQKDIPKIPKFLRAQYYHEFLVFITYEQNREMRPLVITDEIMVKWKEYEPTINTSELRNELPKLYSETISWKMFIPPLPQYKESPFGWIIFKDLVSRLPLSLVTKSHWIERSSDSILEKYLHHPIRQHYLIHSIPEVASNLFDSNINFNQIDDVIKMLGNMGLVQISEKMFKELKKSWIYVNKHGKLLDTSTSDPGYNKISCNKLYPEQVFTFNNTQDALYYWSSLHKIVFTTKLGYKLKRNKNQFTQRKCINDLESVEFAEALLRDVGYIPGDNLGAAGLDTQLYSHLKRNWSWRIKKTLHTAKKKSKLEEECFPKVRRLKRIEIGQTKKKLTLKGGKKILLRGHGYTIKKEKKKQEYDHIDREALKRMKSLRVTWTREEDRFLKTCRSVFLYLGDPFIARTIQYYTVRDILQWAISSLNKTARACHRRMLFMSRYKKDLPDTAAWLHELRQNQYITKLYGVHFLDDLKKVYPSDKEFSSALRIHFIKLVSYLNKILNHLNLSTQNEIILPDTLNQFNMLYEYSPSSIQSDQLKHYEPKTYNEIELSTINELIHSSVCCVKDKTLYNIQLFEIYKGYSEDTLAQAFNKVRNDHLVVATKAKDTPSYTHKLIPVGPSLILSVKYRQQLFISIPYSSIEELNRAFKEYLIKNFTEHNSYDITSTDAGTCLFVAELLTRPSIHIDMQLPQRILTIDPHQEKCKDSERILEHFRRLFENAPKTEYTKHFEETYKETDTQPKIRFNIINESYKLPYNPFDILVKLNDDYIHFFCALNYLNKEVDLNFQQLSQDKPCPFDCILNNVSIIATVEKIISEKRDVIDYLSVNRDEAVDTKAIVTESNLLQIYNKLLKALKARSKKLNEKDLGKISLQPQMINILLFTKELLDYSDQDFINLDGEYMPTVNKEDKIIKAQDIFVVNLTKIKVSYVNHDEEKVLFKDMLVPRALVDFPFKREIIVEKVLRENILSNQHSTMNELITEMSEQGFSTEQQIFTKELLNYIEAHKLGVTSENLLKQFCDESLIIKSILILRKLSWIFRVGVVCYKYVHKNHIQPWVVYTYHIKRLEKETLDSTEYFENPHTQINTEIRSNEPVCKKIKLEGVSFEAALPNEINQSHNISEENKTSYKQREKIMMRPCPWIRVNGSLNRRVLDKWMGTILLECITLNGLDALSLCIRFNMLHPKNIQFLLEILRDIGCVNLKSKSINKSTLLSTYQEPVISDANELTKMENMYIVVVPDALTKLSFFIGDKKYKTDFI